MITGCLQQKNGYYYVLLYLKVNGKRKVKWIATKLPVAGTSERKVRKAFDEIRMQYELEEEERLQREAQEEAMFKGVHTDARQEFTVYMEKWLKGVRATLATATYQSYSDMLRARIIPHFRPQNIPLIDVTPQHIEAFYQKILEVNAPQIQLSITMQLYEKPCKMRYEKTFFLGIQQTRWIALKKCLPWHLL